MRVAFMMNELYLDALLVRTNGFHCSSVRMAEYVQVRLHDLTCDLCKLEASLELLSIQA
jgi:hypothetical protein